MKYISTSLFTSVKLASTNVPPIPLPPLSCLLHRHILKFDACCFQNSASDSLVLWFHSIHKHRPHFYANGVSKASPTCPWKPQVPLLTPSSLLPWPFHYCSLAQWFVNLWSLQSLVLLFCMPQVCVLIQYSFFWLTSFNTIFSSFIQVAVDYMASSFLVAA